MEDNNFNCLTVYFYHFDQNIWLTSVTESWSGLMMLLCSVSCTTTTQKTKFQNLIFWIFFSKRLFLCFFLPLSFPYS